MGIFTLLFNMIKTAAVSHILQEVYRGHSLGEKTCKH